MGLKMTEEMQREILSKCKEMIEQAGDLTVCFKIVSFPFPSGWIKRLKKKGIYPPHVDIEVTLRGKDKIDIYKFDEIMMYEGSSIDLAVPKDFEIRFSMA